MGTGNFHCRNASRVFVVESDEDDSPLQFDWLYEAFDERAEEIFTQLSAQEVRVVATFSNGEQIYESCT